MVRVVNVEARSDFTLRLEFSDGKKGVFDVKPYLEKGIFKELKDYGYFSQIKIFGSTVCWPHEQDFAPETLYLKAVKQDTEAA